MAGWYRVVKTIKGHRYLYDQQTFREGGRVRTRNRYLGPAGGEGEGHAGSNRPTQPGNTATPLFTDPSDFARALASQFDAAQWGRDAQQQVLGGKNTRPAGRRSRRSNARKPVTTTPASRSAAIPAMPGNQAYRPTAGRPGFSPHDVQAEITNTIIEAIETGQANGTLQMPWQAIASERLPVNVITHQPYHGINAFFLSFVAMQHKWPNHWASFQQWKERGSRVRKGEHGVPIVFYSQFQVRDVEVDKEGNETAVVRTIPIFRHSTVFNITQVDNPPDIPPPQHELVNPIENVEKFINETKADIRYGGSRAYFSPSSDYIQMPVREAFTGSKTSSPTEAFYGVILHELCHWTGGKSRLNRDNHNRFGDEAYAAEELVAEIGAAFACATLGITPELREDHVQYVASWLKILKQDKRAIFTASAAAARAVDYLESLQPQE